MKRVAQQSMRRWLFQPRIVLPAARQMPAACQMPICRQFSGVSSAKPWGKPAEGPTFHPEYPTEFRPSPIAGNGWWAKVDIPKGTRLRRVSIADGSLFRFESPEELQASGWDIDDSINYGIGHRADPSAIYFLNPGTACNHADPGREVSVRYSHDEKDVYELWTVRDIKAGEEMLIDYSTCYGPCKWFDDLQNARGNTPLSQLGKIINQSVAGKPWGKPAEGPTFNEKYPTEFRPSPIAGNGWWAKADIPKGVRLRRVSVADGSLIRLGSQKDLEAAGWDIDDSINYGIGHRADPSAIYFLNPGTACNHADPTREVSVVYKHDVKDEYELWTVKDIKVGEELLVNYTTCYGPCEWFDKLQNARGNTPLSQLGKIIDESFLKETTTNTARDESASRSGTIPFKEGDQARAPSTGM